MQYPTEIGAAFFTQKRERNGGMLDIEFKPTDELTLDLSAFSSKLIASNYNRNYLMWSTHFVNFGAGQAPDPGYVVQDNTLTKANFTRRRRARSTASTTRSRGPTKRRPRISSISTRLGMPAVR